MISTTNNVSKEYEDLFYVFLVLSKAVSVGHREGAGSGELSAIAHSPALLQPPRLVC